MARKQIDPLKAKQKKQKIIAAVLGVLFLGLLAFQVPRVMKQLNPPSPSSATGQTSTTAPPGTPTLAAPTLRGAAEGPDAGSPSDSLASAGASALPDGTLASFSRFSSKDPFAQQMGVSSSEPSSGGSTGPGSTPTGVSPNPGTAPAPGTAVISVNGTLFDVPVGTDFPQASTTDPTVVPLFHLVSATAHTVKISIVGGSYSTGVGTVTLKENKPVTLVNTADGTRYTVVLKPQGTTTTPSSPVGTSTTATTTTTTTVPLPPAAP
jgi:hypothetical protein